LDSKYTATKCIISPFVMSTDVLINVNQIYNQTPATCSRLDSNNHMIVQIFLKLCAKF